MDFFKTITISFVWACFTTNLTIALFALISDLGKIAGHSSIQAPIAGLHLFFYCFVPSGHLSCIFLYSSITIFLFITFVFSEHFLHSTHHNTSHKCLCCWGISVWVQFDTFSILLFKSIFASSSVIIRFTTITIFSTIFTHFLVPAFN